MGCHHAGGGIGELRAPVPETPGILQRNGHVEFVWASGSDPSKGKIEAFLPDGRRFRGSFVHPRTVQRLSSYDLYWGAGGGPWSAASPWYPWSGGHFTTHYGGTALAHLEARDGTRMRCEFTLYRPDAGLAGGGQGDCQLSTNEEVFDAVLHERS
jgi:hypothetical protein